MKKYFILILTCLCLVLISCGESKYTPKKPEEIENFKKVDGVHTILTEDVNPYFLIKNKMLDDELLYSITLYMNFEKGDRQNRLYKYFQIDYYLENNSFLCDYHIFDSIDGAIRNYSQNIMPYYYLESSLDNIKFQVKYSFERYNKETKEKDKYNKELTLSENIIKYDSNKSYTDTSDNIVVIYQSRDENYNRYKVSIDLEQSKTGHIDIQIFVKNKQGDIYPYLGLYNYNYSLGSYKQVSDEKLTDENEIVEAYAQINSYENEDVKTYYIGVNIDK